MRLAEYEFDLQHKPERANENADAFSRFPIEPNCHYAEDYYSGFEVEPFVDFYTFITLSTMLGFAQEDQISTDNNTCYLPFDFSFDCLSTRSESLTKHDLATEDESPVGSIALQPSLIKFRAQPKSLFRTRRNHRFSGKQLL